jgi:hypothetical protein
LPRRTCIRTKTCKPNCPTRPIAADGRPIRTLTKPGRADGTMVILAYLPYSVIKDRVIGKMTPRKNQRDLDKPEEFFESLGFL